MPSSHCHQINEIVSLIVQANPQSMLDIGIGFGKYGFLSREYLEINKDERYDQHWQRRIDGIEAFEKYVTPLHRAIYSNIYIGEAQKLLPTLEIRYDLVLLIDVLEHFTFEDGNKILDQCLQRGRNLLVSTPIHMAEQGDTFGNPYETHRFQWRKEHFDRFEKKFFVPNIESLLVFLGEDLLRMHVQRRHLAMGRRFPFLLPLVHAAQRVRGKSEHAR